MDFWKASLTRRWHTNADLSHTCDPTGGHGARVALLALRIKPDLGAAAIIHALTHDLGEYKVGDFPAPFKWANPELAEQIAVMEQAHVDAMGFGGLDVSPEDRALVDLCDRLDAWLWARHHAPHVVEREDWKGLIADVFEKARTAGIDVEVHEIVGAS